MFESTEIYKHFRILKKRFCTLPKIKIIRSKKSKTLNIFLSLPFFSDKYKSDFEIFGVYGEHRIQANLVHLKKNRCILKDP